MIDVRRQLDEWQSGHILRPHWSHSVVASMLFLGKALKELDLPEDEPVIFVCHSGQSSASACEIALVAGLTKVYNLANGMNGWVNRNYPIEL